MFAGMFGIFGHGNVSGIGQALEEVGDDLTYYRPQNEQAMVHSSIAYTRMKNRLQMMACTSSVGPGALNMVTGAATATVDPLPVLLLPGDTFANRIPHPVLQQLEYPLGQDVSVNDCFRPVSRYFDRISRPEQLLSSAPEAMRVLADPAETGAVTLALPEDTQTEVFDYPATFLEKRIHRIVRQIAPESELRYAAAMIGASEKPLIVAGGGVIYSEATETLAHFADEFGIPVATTQAGNGSIPWNHPWYAGPVGSNGGLAANRLAADADLVIAIGTRLSDFTTASRTAFQNQDLRILSINVNAMDAHKAGSFPLVCDAWEAFLGLTPLLQAQGYRTDPAYGDAVESMVGDWNRAVDEQRRGVTGVTLTQGQAIGIVDDATEPTDVVVCAAGGMPGDLLKLWRPLDPKGYHVEYGFSCMGYEIAGGLGVKMAESGPASVRHGRGWQLLDDEFGARHIDRRRHEDKSGGGRQLWVPMHPRIADGLRISFIWKRVAIPGFIHESARRRSDSYRLCRKWRESRRGGLLRQYPRRAHGRLGKSANRDPQHRDPCARGQRHSRARLR